MRPRGSEQKGSGLIAKNKVRVHTLFFSGKGPKKRWAMAPQHWAACGTQLRDGPAPRARGNNKSRRELPGQLRIVAASPRSGRWPPPLIAFTAVYMPLVRTPMRARSGVRLAHAERRGLRVLQ